MCFGLRSWLARAARLPNTLVDLAKYYVIYGVATWAGGVQKPKCTLAVKLKLKLHPIISAVDGSTTLYERDKKKCPRPGSNWRPSDVNLVTKNVIDLANKGRDMRPTS